jgi:chlorophyllase-like protein
LLSIAIFVSASASWIAVGCGGSSGQQGGFSSSSSGGGSSGGQGTGEGTSGGGEISDAGSGGASGDGTISGSGSGSSGGNGGGTSSGSSSGGGGSGTSGGSSGTGGGGNGIKGCGETLPSLSDYTQSGPYTGTTIDNTGPDGGYTVVQPATLGANGFKHPIATWGNGITTTPATYPTLLNLIASHGFVIVASNSSTVAESDMAGGLEWMVQQNTASGQYEGKLDTSCLVSIGYSLGGAGAVSTGSDPSVNANIVTTVAFHPAGGTPTGLKAPLLLFTSTTDTFVVPATFVTPVYNASPVQTFYATLQDAGDPSDLGHIIVVSPTDPEYAPAMAWLRLWVYGDTGGMSYFWGATSAKLCQGPDWACQSKTPPGASMTSGF